MMETEKLRKADVFSGGIVVLLGIFIVIQALGMPMKDSYGGVQNVWYVSPALFPLLVGGMLVLLGMSLMRTALKSVGMSGIKEVVGYLTSHDFVTFLQEKNTCRFYGIILNLLVLVFLLVPRIDFFLGAILFLLIFFFMFYCSTHEYLLKLMRHFIIAMALLSFFLFTPVAPKLAEMIPHHGDLLVIIIIAGLLVSARKELVDSQELAKKYRTAVLIGFLAPLTIGIIFKYFLLVPMPYEGLVVQLLDTIWYADFWS